MQKHSYLKQMQMPEASLKIGVKHSHTKGSYLAIATIAIYACVHAAYAYDHNHVLAFRLSWGIHAVIQKHIYID